MIHIQSKKSRPWREETSPAEITFTPDTGESDVDDLLDEIDEVLETNAQEFVSAYIQRNGE